MAELRVTRQAEASRTVPGVAADGRGGEPPREQPSGERQPRREGAAPELAAALSGDGKTAVTAIYELGADGAPRIRIVESERGETVAILTPQELRAMAASTGLPPGILVRATS